MGAEVKIDGPPPTDEKECTFLTVDALLSHLRQGRSWKMVHYMLCWRMRDASTGAGGETVNATIRAKTKKTAVDNTQALAHYR